MLQLCDALALPSGFVLLEKRLFDVSLRYGVDGFTTLKQQVFPNLQIYLKKTIGRSVYSALPGVADNTFGFTP